WGTGRAPVPNARKDLDPIALLARAGHFRLADAPAVELCLHDLIAQLDSGRATVEDDAQCRTVRLPPRRDPKDTPKAIVHLIPCSRSRAARGPAAPARRFGNHAPASAGSRLIRTTPD